MNLEKKGIVNSDNFAEYVEKGREATQHNKGVEENYFPPIVGSELPGRVPPRIEDIIKEAEQRGAAKLAEELLGSVEKMDRDKFGEFGHGFAFALDEIETKIKELCPTTTDSST